MCYINNIPSQYRREPLEKRINDIIAFASKNLSLDLEPYRETMFEGREDELAFTYLGPGIIRKTPHDKKPYNCVLDAGGLVFYILTETKYDSRKGSL